MLSPFTQQLDHYPVINVKKNKRLMDIKVLNICFGALTLTLHNVVGINICISILEAGTHKPCGDS